MTIIRDNENLKLFVNRFKQSPYITIDTEFMRTRTYYPELCLVQIASVTEAIVIDPIEGDIDLRILSDLLLDNNVVKVFHSGRQDLEIIYKALNILPKPIFDTQVAALICGLGNNISYANLVKQFCDVQIDKTLQFSKWKDRPLDEMAINYAMGDVTYLRDIYQDLKSLLTKMNRTSWLEEEMNHYCDAKNYDFDVAALWQKLLPTNNHDAVIAYLLKDLLIFRENLAQKLDIPRNYVIKDSQLQEITKARPNNRKLLRKILSRARLSSNDYLEIENIIEQSTKFADCELVEKKFSLEQEKPLIRMYKILLAKKAAKYNIAEKFIASNEDILKYALNYDGNVKFLSGWRSLVFGQDAKKLKEGKIALFIDNEGHIVMKDNY